jgi:crossover junction endodeoxyribonuclease RuvC
MQAMVKALLKMPEEPRPDDAADALAVAICHLHSRRLRDMGVT